MKRRVTIKYFIVLILIAGVFLIIINVCNIIIQQELFNSKTTNENRHNFIDNRIDDSSTTIKRDILSKFYRLSSDSRYHYEFRFEFNPSTENDDHRVMLILYGAKRSCSDMWDFSVGTRILIAIRSFGYSFLTVCSGQETYDINLPISNNSDAKYIYLSVQIWINTVYYPRFKRYPLLYIHATSRGARFAGILSRILPIQAQLFFAYPGHRLAMIIPSAYDSNMQKRLIFNSSYTNWFYFNFCYNTRQKKIGNRTLCPFNSNEDYLYPLPPSFFTYLKNDPYQKQEYYRHFIRKLSQKSLSLGGILLAYNETLPLDILPPVQLNVSYMQEYFHRWRTKPYAAQWFYEHFTNPEKYRTFDETRQTCWCSEIDFKYFEIVPYITTTWSKKNNKNIVIMLKI